LFITENTCRYEEREAVKISKKLEALNTAKERNSSEIKTADEEEVTEENGEVDEDVIIKKGSSLQISRTSPDLAIFKPLLFYTR